MTTMFAFDCGALEPEATYRTHCDRCDTCQQHQTIQSHRDDASRDMAVMHDLDVRYLNDNA